MKKKNALPQLSDSSALWRYAWYMLCAVGFLGFGLRIFQLGSNPAILNRDEAALAYNALLLQQTGSDEWRQSWPLALQSFGDYKLPGYPYLLVMFFQLFGQSDLVVRLPSALAGTGLIFLSFFFARKLILSSDSDDQEKTSSRFYFPILATVFVTLQPVFFYYSRMAWEANVGLFLFLSSITVLFVLQRSWWKDAIGVLLMLLAVYTYNTPLLLLPFILPICVFMRGMQNWRAWSGVVLGLSVVAAVGFSSLLSLSEQKSGITIFNDESYWKMSVDHRENYTGIWQKILGSKYVFFSKVIAENYIKTFSPQFLVMQGGAHPWHSLPGYGHISWTVYCFGIFGILFTIRKGMSLLKKESHFSLLLLYMLLIAPLPAVITVDAPHATRSLLFFFTYTLFAVKGIRDGWEILKEKGQPADLQKLGVGFATVLGILVITESSFYFHKYFTQYPQLSTQILQGGFETQLQQLQNYPVEQNLAIVDEAGYQYIVAAWYLKMPPSEFFGTITRHLPDRVGLRYGYKVGRFRFIAAEEDRFSDERTLLVWDKEQKKWQVKQY